MGTSPFERDVPQNRRTVLAALAAPLLASCGSDERKSPKALTMEIPNNWQGYSPDSADHPYAIAMPKEATRGHSKDSDIFSFPESFFQDDRNRKTYVTIFVSPLDPKIPFKNVIDNNYPKESIQPTIIDGQPGFWFTREKILQKGIGFTEKEKTQTVLFARWNKVWELTLYTDSDKSWNKKVTMSGQALDLFKTFDPSKPVPQVTFTTSGKAA